MTTSFNRTVVAHTVMCLLGVALTSSAQDTTAAAARPAFPIVHVVTGGSTVLATDFNVSRIAVTNPAVAEATVIEPRELLIDGKGAGTVSLVVWGEGRRLQYDVTVDPPATPLQQQLRLLFPGEDIRVNVSDEATILSGRVSSNNVALRAAEIAEKSSAKTKLINLLQLPGGDNQQVMLQVRVAEVNHRALLEVGSTLFTGPTGYKDFVARSSTQQFSAPDFTDLTRKVEDGVVTDLAGKFTFSDFLNLFVLNTKFNVGVLIKALQTRGFFQSLAEPTLIAYNGQEASFLAGGEIPVPIAQGLTGAVSVAFKEFGVRLTFKPTIAGDVIRLKVRPEVSSLDFSNGITLSGFKIPALTTRRAETEVELRDGQSFAIGGLLNNVTQNNKLQIPGLGSLPIIGHLFRSRAEMKERTELVVLVTPRLIRPLEPGEAPALPTVPGAFLDDRTINAIQGAPVRPSATPER